jgi:hypothetical protein
MLAAMTQGRRGSATTLSRTTICVDSREVRYVIVGAAA